MLYLRDRKSDRFHIWYVGQGLYRGDARYFLILKNSKWPPGGGGQKQQFFNIFTNISYGIYWITFTFGIAVDRYEKVILRICDLLKNSK